MLNTAASLHEGKLEDGRRGERAQLREGACVKLGGPEAASGQRQFRLESVK